MKRSILLDLVPLFMHYDGYMIAGCSVSVVVMTD